jgi:hypothetical protein
VLTPAENKEFEMTAIYLALGLVLCTTVGFLCIRLAWIHLTELQPAVAAAAGHWLKELMLPGRVLDKHEGAAFVTALTHEIAVFRVANGRYPELCAASEVMIRAIRRANTEGISFPMGASMEISEEKVAIGYGFNGSDGLTTVWSRQPCQIDG